MEWPGYVQDLPQGAHWLCWQARLAAMVSLYHGRNAHSVGAVSWYRRCTECTDCKGCKMGNVLRSRLTLLMVGCCVALGLGVLFSGLPVALPAQSTSARLLHTSIYEPGEATY